MQRTGSGYPSKQGLYDPRYEHDACGIGFVADIRGRRSHSIVRQAMQVLCNLDHRGGQGCETNTGDGAGILMQIPYSFFRQVCADDQIRLPEEGKYGVGMVFLPQDESKRQLCTSTLEKFVREVGLTVLGWRDVPTDNSTLGDSAKSVEPVVRQLFIGRAEDGTDQLAFERKLYVIRKRSEHALLAAGVTDAYLPSLSSRTIVFKGMLTPDQVSAYYTDLLNPAFETALALVHSRFSTNTFPSWERAHPYRYIIHNGEINTLRGNVNWMRARQAMDETDLFGDDFKSLLPIIDVEGSDSQMFDNCLEYLMLSGRSLPHAAMMMIPEPWSNHESMNAEMKAFYEFHSCLMEPWDGPAAICFTDGAVIGAVLDRNGLRPARYYVTKDDLIVLSSEVGVLDIPADRIVAKERLRPGRMLLVDTEKGRIVSDEELKSSIAAEHPYKEWVEQHMINLEQLPDAPAVPDPDRHTLARRQQAFGYTFEELTKVLEPMAGSGVEAIGSMGIDTPLAVLSNRPQLLYNYFKQLFAQVTNPPIDAIREELVTAIGTTIGPERSLIRPEPESCRHIRLKTPILSNEELAKLKCNDREGFQPCTLPTLFEAAGGADALEEGLRQLFASADEAIDKGAQLLILSDRGINEKKAAIPTLLAVSGLHHHLIREGTRMKVSLIVESGEPREVHHFALLLGYGAGAINPYLALESLDGMIGQKILTGITHAEAVYRYIKAATKGVVKVLSKMGISTVQSYRGAQIFEAIGLKSALVEQYFTWTPTRIEGIGLDVIAEETLSRHRRAFSSQEGRDLTLDAGGEYQYRREGDLHLYRPETIHALQNAARTNNFGLYRQYAAMVNDHSRQTATLRGLLQFKPTAEAGRAPVPIDEVESVEAICRRFKTGAMSYGSIS